MIIFGKIKYWIITKRLYTSMLIINDTERKRIKGVEENVKILKELVVAQDKYIEDLEIALKWYADENTYLYPDDNNTTINQLHYFDYGYKARIALKHSEIHRK